MVADAARRRAVIVGGGPAGVRAAEVLVEAGLRPVLVDEADRPGGQVYRQRPDGLAGRTRRLYGFDARKAERLHAVFDRIRGRLVHHPDTLAWNVQDGVLHLYRGNAFSAVPYDALILATGATDRALPVPGWTLPGSYTLGGAQVALKYQACAIGRRVVFAGSTPLLYLVAHQYAKAGAGVAAVLDTGSLADKARGLPRMLASPARVAQGLYYVAALRARGIPIHDAVTRVEITGEGAVAGLRFRDGRGAQREVRCDAVAMGFHLRPETQLADLAGCDFRYDATSREWLPAADDCGRAGRSLYLAGDGMRIGGADAAETGGALAACAVLADWEMLPATDARIARLRREHARLLRFQQGVMRAFPLPDPLLADVPDDLMLCRCEAVTLGAYRKAIRAGLGADDVNRGKAASRVGMGRCQGRYCAASATAVLSAQRSVTHEAAGRLRAQAPVKPLALATTQAGDGDAAHND